MTADFWLSAFAVLILLGFSFVFSGSETALTATSRARMLQLEKGGNRRAGIVNRLLEAREKLIGALLVGNNLVNTAAATLTTAALLDLFGDVGIVYATIVVSILSIVFAEVMPKSLAIKYPERSALIAAPVVRVIVLVLTPVTASVNWFVRLVLRAFGTNVGANAALLSGSDELRGTVDLLHKEGSVEKTDRDMLGGLLDLRELTVADVMVHRTKMFMIDGDEPMDRIVAQVLAAQYTRIPIYRDRPDNIVGMLHSKDVLRALAAVKNDAEKLSLDEVALPAWFVPDTTPLDEQLKSFRRRKSHFALVVDEYGELMGLVTLEDIIEEIVGEIADEHDLVVTGVRPQKDGVVNVDGSVPIRDLNRAMDWSLPDEEATTIAGLVIHAARTIPEAGQTFTFYGFRFQVLRKQRNRITSLRITPLDRPVLKA